MKVGLIFPGQGSQYVGMGSDFLLKFPELNEFLECADDILGFSLSKIMINGPKEKLIETMYSQTALYVHSCMILKKMIQQFPFLNIKVVAGLSLGEYTAITAAKKVLFEDLLPIVKCRGELMNKACLSKQGGMAAVLGLSSEKVEQVLDCYPGLDVWIANYNSPSQTVISGSLIDIDRLSDEFKKIGAKRVVKLDVFGAFHSPYMRLPENNFLKEMIDKMPVRETDIDIIMNISSDKVYNSLDIKNNLLKQICSPVRWYQSIILMNSEVDIFIEVGAGKILSNLNKQIGGLKPTINVGKISELEEFFNFFGDEKRL